MTGRSSDVALSDEELVRRGRTGEDGATDKLLARYRGLARVKARRYFLAGADHEDLIQEGMIGLFKAVRDFQPLRGASFHTFAEMCVSRQVLTAVKSASRHKHAPLNGYLSLSQPASADGDQVLADVLPLPSGGDPADVVISGERIRALGRHLEAVLSDLETQVLHLYVDGKTYSEIAYLLQRRVKAIDNALQRIKRKLEWHLRERALAEVG